MKLLAVGDSFTRGDELTDLTQSWPNLIAQQLDCELINLGIGGAGNTKILRNAVENIADCDIVIAAWSHFDRIELADEEGVYELWPGRTNIPFVKSFPWRQTVADYNARYHSDTYLYKQYLTNILLFQSLAIAHNKKYLMLDAFGNHQSQFRNAPEFTHLIKQIDIQHFVGWPNESMMEWADNAEKGPRGHFLELGHKRVADKIYEHIRNLGWFP